MQPDGNETSSARVNPQRPDKSPPVPLNCGARHRRRDCLRLARHVAHRGATRTPAPPRRAAARRSASVVITGTPLDTPLSFQRLLKRLHLHRDCARRRRTRRPRRGRRRMPLDFPRHAHAPSTRRASPARLRAERPANAASFGVEATGGLNRSRRCSAAAARRRASSSSAFSSGRCTWPCAANMTAFVERAFQMAMRPFVEERVRRTAIEAAHAASRRQDRDVADAAEIADARAFRPARRTRSRETPARAARPASPAATSRLRKSAITSMFAHVFGEQRRIVDLRV